MRSKLELVVTGHQRCVARDIFRASQPVRPGDVHVAAVLQPPEVEDLRHIERAAIRSREYAAAERAGQAALAVHLLKFLPGPRLELLDALVRRPGRRELAPERHADVVALIGALKSILGAGAADQ